MASAFQGPPAVDFYGMLSGLGDSIHKGQLERAQNAKDQAGLAAFSQLDPNSPNYGAAAQAAFQNGNLEAGQKLLQLQIADQDRKHGYSREGVTDSHWNQDMALRQKQFDANNEGPEEVAQQRAAAATRLGLTPGSPEFRQYALTGQLPDPVSNKPVPYETLSGTKFLVPKPGGGYTTLDPREVGGGAPVPSSPTVIGDAEGVSRGLYEPPAAPGQRPPMPGLQPAQVASAQPSDFAGRFQGQPAPPPPPVDLEAIDPTTGRRENFLKSQDRDAQEYLKKVANYEIDPRTSSTKGGKREQILSAVAKYDPTYNQNEFGTRAKAMKDFATGPQGNAVRSFDVAMDHLDLLKQYSKALGGGDIRTVNALRNKWLQETGSPLPTNVQAIAPIVGAEVSKAVIGSNNALADREELRKPLSLANSPEQIAGAITGYQGLMAGQLKGLRKQYEDTTGKKDFNSRVREGTRKILLGGGDDQTSGALAPGNYVWTGRGTEVVPH